MVISDISPKPDKGDGADKGDKMDKMDIVGLEGIRGILAEMAEVDLDYPFKAFYAALRDSDLTRQQVESVIGELFRQTLAFDADQREWMKTAYND